MNSKDDNSIPSINELIKLFQFKPVFAKPKICSRESSPPREEGSSGVHDNRARGTVPGNVDRNNQPAGTDRGSAQVAPARGIERAGSSNEYVDGSRRAGNVNTGKVTSQVSKARSSQYPGNAKQSQLVDNAGGGDSSPRRESVSKAKKMDNNVTVSDRGKAGAGVTGSRKGQIRGDNVVKLRSQDDMPLEQSAPGLLRHIHNAARYRIPQCFEGGVVSVKQSTANSNWVLGHSMSFSSVSPGGYKVLLSYAEKNRSDAGPYFVLEAAPGGQMSCELRVSPSQRTRASVVAQIADKQLYGFESIFDVYFKSSTASILAVNKEFIALHYLKSITDRFSLGAEVVARSRDRSLSSASTAARWCDDDNSLSATLGDRGLDVCYARNIKPFLTVASMLEIGFGIQRAVATLAYEWHTQDWTVRGSVDSDGLVGATLQRGLGGRRAQLACEISALLNHPNDKFKLGFGITAAIE